MQLNEIFRNFVNEHGDNATCHNCGAQFTIPAIVQKHSTMATCPNCGENNLVKDAMDRYEEDQHIMSQAPDEDPFADGEMTGGQMGNSIGK